MQHDAKPACIKYKVSLKYSINLYETFRSLSAGKHLPIKVAATVIHN